VTPDVVRRQQSIADTFEKLGLIPHAITISDVVWTPDAKLSAAGAR
jgi:sulfonate transport system substrate-binding protein